VRFFSISCGSSEKRKDEMEGNTGNHWLELPNDGDSAVVVVLGEPFAREVCFIDGRFVPVEDAPGHEPSLLVALNMALLDSKEVKVLEHDVGLLMELVWLRQRYPLEEWSFEVQRDDGLKELNETYMVVPKRQLSVAEQQEFAELSLHDLSVLCAKPSAARPIEL
jgi:hypothetical protein